MHDVERQSIDPWHPMTDQLALKHLGKLGEESGELVTVVSRCVIQGIDECDPETQFPNRLWLEDEIADVLANADLVIGHFQLDTVRIAERITAKQAKLRVWHSMAPDTASDHSPQK